MKTRSTQRKPLLGKELVDLDALLDHLGRVLAEEYVALLELGPPEPQPRKEDRDR